MESISNPLSIFLRGFDAGLILGPLSIFLMAVSLIFTCFRSKISATLSVSFASIAMVASILGCMYIDIRIDGLAQILPFLTAGIAYIIVLSLFKKPMHNLISTIALSITITAYTALACSNLFYAILVAFMILTIGSCAIFFYSYLLSGLIEFFFCEEDDIEKEGNRKITAMLNVIFYISAGAVIILQIV